MAPDDPIETLLEGIYIELTCQTYSHWNVVNETVRHQLVKIPQALLGKSEGKRTSCPSLETSLWLYNPLLFINGFG